MIRFGLCCIFRREPIQFRQVTAKTLSSVPRQEQLKRLSDICLHNVLSLQKSLVFAARRGIGAFRILSPLFPRYTHPEVGYRVDELEAAEEIDRRLNQIRQFRQERDIRLSFHPDQFNVLSSPHKDVVKNTMRELQYQGFLADLVGAEVINIHAGGVYGDKAAALGRLQNNIERLPTTVYNKITLENDDVSYAPIDLLPICDRLNIPLVYDVHHHRCLPDGLTEEEATSQAVELWQRLNREPYFHLSSPKNGWGHGSPKPHADFIDPADFPKCWENITATVDIEAKAKEVAVLQLMQELEEIHEGR